MEKIYTYEQYSEVLAEFKKGKARCSTNKFPTRDELVALIEAGKLFYEEIDGVLWFFSNERYFYYANFYVPSDVSIRMRKQNMPVLVELTGNQARYNEQWERELIAAGYEKGDRYLGFSSQLDAIIDEVKKQNKVLHAFCEKRGYTYRKAVRADLPEIWALWESKLEDRPGKPRYTLRFLTDAELEEMERYRRCSIICDTQGKIVATDMYVKRGATAHALHTATAYPGSGLGACIVYENLLTMYQDGCTKVSSWVRDDNHKSINLALQLSKKTGKFFQQFACPANDSGEAEETCIKTF